MNKDLYPTQVSEGITLFLLLALIYYSCIFTINIFISLHLPIQELPSIGYKTYNFTALQYDTLTCVTSMEKYLNKTIYPIMQPFYDS